MVSKILIVSDSHGKTENVKKAIEREKPDMLIHLGDIEDDPEKVRRWLEGKPAVFVQGNCDRYGHDDLKKVAIFDLNGHKFFCTHGHMQGVSYGPQNLMYTALENGCDIAMFGHTHVPFDEEYPAPVETLEKTEEAAGSIRIMNPGSISLPRGGSRRSYMIMTFDSDGGFSVKLKKLFI